MIRVGENVSGTIGKRVADGVRLQPDMELIGVAKPCPNYEAETQLAFLFGSCHRTVSVWSPFITAADNVQIHIFIVE